MGGVDVWVVRQVGAGGVPGDVVSLRFEVAEVADAVFEVARVPDLAGGLFACGVGVAAFDKLNCLGGADVDCRGEQDVDVIGHDGIGVEEEFALGAVALEGCEEEFGVIGALEVAMLSEGGDGEGVGGELLTLGRHEG